MSVWYALLGTVAIRLTPEARRIVDEFNELGVEIEADLDDHCDGTATVEFRGGEFCSYATVETLDGKTKELVPFVLRPAHLSYDCDGEKGEIPLGASGDREHPTVTLLDRAEGATGTLEVQLDCDGSCLEIKPAGYGEHDAEDGHGAPVLLEFHGGCLRLVVAPDINVPDNQIISLEGAREAKRI